MNTPISAVAESITQALYLCLGLSSLALIVVCLTLAYLFASERDGKYDRSYPRRRL